MFAKPKVQASDNHNASANQDEQLQVVEPASIGPDTSVITELSTIVSLSKEAVTNCQARASGHMIKDHPPPQKLVSARLPNAQSLLGYHSKHPHVLSAELNVKLPNLFTDFWLSTIKMARTVLDKVEAELLLGSDLLDVALDTQENDDWLSREAAVQTVGPTFEVSNKDNLESVASHSTCNAVEQLADVSCLCLLHLVITLMLVYHY